MMNRSMWSVCCLVTFPCVIVSAVENGCIFMNAGAKTPTSGIVYSAGISKEVPAGFAFKYLEQGLFCPSCTSNTSCDYSRCHDVPRNYDTPSDGMFTADGVQKPITRAERTSTEGRFCPTCLKVSMGDVSESPGIFISDDLQTSEPNVPTGTEFPMAGLFCTGQRDTLLSLSRLVITPRWTNFAAFNEAKGMLSGSMTVEYQWYWYGKNGYADGKIEEPHLSVQLENFASGSSGRVVSGMYKDAPLPGLDIYYRRNVVTYVGDFRQSLDGSCYPWDEQNISFEFRVPWPYNTNMELVLRCTGHDADCSNDYVCAEHELDPLGNCEPDHLRSFKNVRFEGKTAMQFEWSALQCVKTNTDRVLCSMRATRAFTKSLLMHFVPGLLLSIIGFGSFLVPYNMAMPRVATTMISLLTFVNKGNSVVGAMPSGGLNVVEEFYIWGMVVMMVNMIGHILSWKMPIIAPLVNELQLGFVFLTFVLYFFCSIYARGCRKTSSTGLIFGIVCVALALFFSLVWSIRRHRKDLAVAVSYAKSNAMKMHKGGKHEVCDDEEMVETSATV
eukprot:TRINITY_DN8566_c0_g1_i1.p1 TRINITY_DN8566_c0_g1~~TRINITY_DN8566_c0_g1_i1.p1  ORF type:complete len:557 (+),score=27.94 TRINITY_DN8566_c0_g1_i1:84-1754(+)